jgi:hypothetical protein
MNEEIKSLKLLLGHYDEEGNYSEKETTDKINKPKDISESLSFGNISMRKYSLSYSLKIPEHIHSFLIGKIVPADYSWSSKGDMIEYKEDFSKTLNHENLSILCSKYYKVLQDYDWLKNRDKLELKKVIFYSFETQLGEYRSSWDSKPLGKKTNIAHICSVGFVSKQEGKEHRFDENRNLISLRNDGFYRLKHIDYTDERMNFFDGILESFRKVNEKFEAFNEQINNGEIEKLIKERIQYKLM